MFKSPSEENFVYNYLSVQSTLKNEKGTIVQNTNNWDLLKGLCGPIP